MGDEMQLTHRKESNNISIDCEMYSCEFNIDNQIGIKTNSTYGLRRLKYKPTNKNVSPEGCPKEHVGSLCLYKAYSENAWLKTFRSDEYKIKIDNDIVILTWTPTISHQLETVVEYCFTGKNYIDIKISLEAYGYYRNYEIVLSNYLFSDFINSVIVKDKIATKRIITLNNDLFYQDTYLFFPRNEKSINIMSDGRHQKGHWYWECSYGREYDLPMIISTDDDTEVILMGLKDDIYSIGTTYSGKGGYKDDVIEHYAQYLRLFGEDIEPGTKKQTIIRCYIKEKENGTEVYEKIFEEFQNDYCDFKQDMEMGPHVKYGFENKTA
jgi:hypothetical protein